MFETGVFRMTKVIFRYYIRKEDKTEETIDAILVDLRDYDLEE